MIIMGSFIGNCIISNDKYLYIYIYEEWEIVENSKIEIGVKQLDWTSHVIE